MFYSGIRFFLKFLVVNCLLSCSMYGVSEDFNKALVLPFDLRNSEHPISLKSIINNVIMIEQYCNRELLQEESFCNAIGLSKLIFNKSALQNLKRNSKLPEALKTDMSVLFEATFNEMRRMGIHKRLNLLNEFNREGYGAIRYLLNSNITEEEAQLMVGEREFLEPEHIYAVMRYAMENDHPEIVQLLAASGQNMRNQIFIAACRYGKVQLVESFLRLHTRDREQLMNLYQHIDDAGYTPLMIAAGENRLEVLNLLIDSFGPNRELLVQRLLDRDDFNNTSLMLAAAAGRDQIVVRLLDYYRQNDLLADHLQNDVNNQGNSALLLAVESESLETVQEIINAYNAQGFDIHQDRNNSLENAVIMASAEGLFDIVKELLRHGEYNFLTQDIELVHWRNDDTALMVAAKNGHVEVVNHLLQKACERQQLSDLLKVKNYRGNNVFSIVIISNIINERRRIDIIRKLLDYCRQNNIEVTECLNISDNFLLTPLMHAACRGNSEVFRMIASVYGDEVIDALKQKNHSGDNALMLVSKAGNIEIIEYIINLYKRYDSESLYNYLQQVNTSGRSVLMHTVMSGSERCFDFIITCLMEFEGGVSSALLGGDLSGITPLISAILMGNLVIVKRIMTQCFRNEITLLSMINQQTAQGDNAITFATKFGRSDILNYFLQHYSLIDLAKSVLVHKGRDGKILLEIALGGRNRQIIKIILIAYRKLANWYSCAAGRGDQSIVSLLEEFFQKNFSAPFESLLERFQHLLEEQEFQVAELLNS